MPEEEIFYEVSLLNFPATFIRRPSPDNVLRHQGDRNFAILQHDLSLSEWPQPMHNIKSIFSVSDFSSREIRFVSSSSMFSEIVSGML